MRRETVELMLTRYLADQIAQAYLARPASALMPLMTVRLMKTAVAVGAGTVLADMTECDFNGYAAVQPASTVGPVNISTPGRALLADVDFVAGTALAPGGQIAYGYYLTDTPATTLFAGELFNTPVNFGNPGDALALDLYLPAPFGVPTGLDE